MDQSLEEYKTLRSEILRNFEASERNLLACITANGVALAYGIKESQPLVIVLAILIPIYFWIQQTFYRKNIAKIGSYIATFLEGHEKNLMWETRIHLMDSKEKGVGFAYVLRALFHPYPILLIVSIIILIWTLKLPYRLLISFIITLLIWLIALKTYRPYAKIRAPWIDGWENIKLEEQPKSHADPNIDRTQKQP
ncbi:MAG: hypothetical protein ACOZFS_12045 [Thermodesulfobacteriota bacterium]